jgi:hypothetical protein
MATHSNTHFLRAGFTPVKMRARTGDRPMNAAGIGALAERCMR